jgi:hypothetical protein
VVALIGVALLVVVFTLLVPGQRETATLPPPPPPFLPAPTMDLGPAAPGGSGPATSAPVASAPGPSAPGTSAPAAQVPAATATATRPAAPARARPATTPPEITVTGSYRVVDSFGDGFIGEVQVVNTTARDRGWTVRLRFPDNVGALRTSWVESAPQASVSTAGDTFVWTSGVPVRARSSVALRFHFARSGSGERPRACTVNGTACG